MATTKREDQIGSVLVALFSVTYLVGSFLIKKPVYHQQLGPDGFPKAVGFLMTLLSIIYMYQAFFKGIKEDETRAAIIGAEDKVEQKANVRKMGSIILVMILYASLFSLLGYAVSTFLAFFGGLMVLDRRKWLRDLIIAAIASFGFYFVFTLVLRVDLPPGLLGLLGL
ncbi:MAG: tripartite tricarboxylate transporter TctB family protein [Spirochaetota bacterium]